MSYIRPFQTLCHLSTLVDIWVGEPYDQVCLGPLHPTTLEQAPSLVLMRPQTLFLPYISLLSSKTNFQAVSWTPLPGCPKKSQVHANFLSVIPCPFWQTSLPTLVCKQKPQAHSSLPTNFPAPWLLVSYQVLSILSAKYQKNLSLSTLSLSSRPITSHLFYQVHHQHSPPESSFSK